MQKNVVARARRAEVEMAGAGNEVRQQHGEDGAAFHWSVVDSFRSFVKCGRSLS